MKYIQLLILLLIANSVVGQNTFDIKNPQRNLTQKCGKCIETLNNLPREVQYGIQRDNMDNLYFVISDKQSFEKLFKKSGDGIAVDIVTKDQYVCGGMNNFTHSWAAIGTLIPPVYLKDMKKNILPSQHGEVTVMIGSIPEALRGKELEFNLIILQNKYLCHYNTFYDIKRFRWDLLDMGLYMDTITYQAKFDTTQTINNKLAFHNKRLKFTIPFERNKSEYSKEDMQPLYDSLRLTDHNITNIEIRAYSSVEGSEKRNIALQEKRAENIVKALQSFQSPEIKQKVIVSENWVEFYRDMSASSYSYLSKLEKSEIKEKLKNNELLQKLEPYLSNHRKAILIIDLEKKSSITYTTPDQIQNAFKKAIEENNLDEALEIQKSIFSKILDNKLPTDFIKSMEIPEKSEYALLLNNQAAFKHMIDETDVYTTYLEYKKLEDLFPEDGHIKYNLCALKFRIWILGKELVDPKEFKTEINKLSSYGIPSGLIKRMLVNYNIVMCEYYMKQGDYANKDKSLGYIYSKYRYLDNTDADLLSIAQYFVSYAKYDWAIKLLEPKVKTIDADEDLLFYYLNLTVVDPKQTEKTSYRNILLNAINMNKERFCQMFSPYGTGGVSFQLLRNEYIKRTYCESCNE